MLHERLLWVPMLLYPTASEREECMLAMLFWVLAALAVVGALAIDWGLYLIGPPLALAASRGPGPTHRRLPRPANVERWAG